MPEKQLHSKNSNRKWKLHFLTYLVVSAFLGLYLTNFVMKSDAQESLIKHNLETGNSYQDQDYESLTKAFQSSISKELLLRTDEEETLFSQSNKLIASDGTGGDWFGVTVAIDGDTAIVGADRDDINGVRDRGSAYIYVRNGTTWTEQQKLVANDGAIDDLFGRSVDIDGDTVIVSSLFDDVNGNENQGSAYIFTRNGTTLTQQAHLIATQGEAFDLSGHSVAISGNTVVMGVLGGNVNGVNQSGAAYVFTRNGSNWTQQARLFANDGAALDQFGVSVDIDGDTAIVGSYNDDIGTRVDQGSAYIFTRSGTVWTFQSKLIANDGASEDHFGISVGISGNTAVAGAFFDDVNGNVKQGSAYVFKKTGSSWSQQTHLKADDGVTEDRFGINVVVEGDKIIVGANHDDYQSSIDQGSSYIYTLNNGIWMLESKITGNDSDTGDFFGFNAAISGNTIIIGAYFHDFGGDDRGAAYIFNNVANENTAFDFDGDSQTDISLFRPLFNEWWYNRSSDGNTSVFTFGAPDNTLTPADYTGDGKTDISF